ncbi:hypothetical protein LX36DRAFT_85730 [Colletotrichum falcatum]|nr:hypothetical protein LX36DRAFT_85730 [Colletotrichum falcatum]
MITSVLHAGEFPRVQQGRSKTGNRASNSCGLQFQSVPRCRQCYRRTRPLLQEVYKHPVLVYPTPVGHPEPRRPRLKCSFIWALSSISTSGPGSRLLGQFCHEAFPHPFAIRLVMFIFHGVDRRPRDSAMINTRYDNSTKQVPTESKITWREGRLQGLDSAMFSVESTAGEREHDDYRP